MAAAPPLLCDESCGGRSSVRDSVNSAKTTRIGASGARLSKRPSAKSSARYLQHKACAIVKRRDGAGWTAGTRLSKHLSAINSIASRVPYLSSRTRQEQRKRPPPYYRRRRCRRTGPPSMQIYIMSYTRKIVFIRIMVYIRRGVPPTAALVGRARAAGGSAAGRRI